MKETTNPQQKAEAVKRMRLLGIKEEYIRDFERDGKIYFSARDKTLPKLSKENIKIIKEFENDYHALVYMVIREDSEYGMMDALMYVSDAENDWPLEEDELNLGYAFTHVINHRCPEVMDFYRIGFARTPDGEIALD